MEQGGRLRAGAQQASAGQIDGGAGIDVQDKSKQIIKKYHQSVLKDAVAEGFIKVWREGGVKAVKTEAQAGAGAPAGAKPETRKSRSTSRLLKRIFKERRKKLGGTLTRLIRNDKKEG